jgi:hypothetical protein
MVLAGELSSSESVMDNNNLAAGDPFAYAGQKRHEDLEHISDVVRRTHTDLLTAIREEQERLGRHKVIPSPTS